MGKALAVLITSLRLSEVSEIEKRRWERYGLQFHVYITWKDASGSVEEKGSRMSAMGTVVRNESVSDPHEGYELGIMFNRSYP
jgi:hypothetical protein